MAASKSSKPWDRRPFPKIGDLSSDTAYRAVGEALTLWAFFEVQLARLFSAFVGQRRDPMVAHRAYGAVTSFEGRRRMMEEAAIAYFHLRQLRAEYKPKTDRDFTELLCEARHYNSRRNEIAHGIVMPYGMVNRGIEDEETANSYVLAPPEFATNWRKIPAKLRPPAEPPDRTPGVAYACSSNEIDDFKEHFRLIARRATSLAPIILR
jgi:hypothetical protein